MVVDYSKTYLYKLHLLTNGLDKAFDKVLTENAGITFSQFTLLLAVNQYKTVSQRQVASFLEVSPAAISRQVSVASERGWVNVKQVEGNKREVRLSLTSGGEQVIKTGLEVLEKNLFSIFEDSEQKFGLMSHLDLLLGNIKLLDQSNKKGDSMDIPKARALYRGDINDAVIRVQKATGIIITPDWWNSKVGNNGSSEQILDRFDQAYAKLIAEKTK